MITNFSKDIGVTTLDWPSKRPDLNIMGSDIIILRSVFFGKRCLQRFFKIYQIQDRDAFKIFLKSKEVKHFSKS